VYSFFRKAGGPAVWLAAVLCGRVLG
jgi:hypothetical protein